VLLVIKKKQKTAFKKQIKQKPFWSLLLCYPVQ